MSQYETKKLIYASPSFIPEIVKCIMQEFSLEGFEVYSQEYLTDSVEVNITKKGFFKSILGQQTGLKVTLTPKENSIYFEAKVGVVSQNAVAVTIAYMTVPVLCLVQMWNIGKAAKLDDKALAIAEGVIARAQRPVAPPTAFVNPVAPVPTSTSINTIPGQAKFCTNCGTAVPPNAKFCSSCGSPLQ